MVSGSLSDFEEGATADGSHPLFTYEEVFNKHFPFYLSIGMSYEDYWERDCTLVIAYKKAFDMKKERDNEMMWLQGLYIYDSLLRIAPMLQAFGKGKVQPYVEKPYDLSKKAIENTKKQKEEEQFKKGKRFMEQFSILHNLEQDKRKGGEKNG